MLTIQKKFIKYNISPRNGTKPHYIVIHDTGNTNKGANAIMHYNYFNGGNRSASADFFVDDSNIIQTVDYKVNYSWHCGDGGGKYGITNKNSIGVEICINSDGNYTKAFQNAVELVAYLSKELNIPFEKIVRHYDASRKTCPASMSANNWSKWQEFKAAVNKQLNPAPDYKEVALTDLYNAGLISDLNGWIAKKDDPAPVWMVAVIINNLYKKLKN
jgi:N-acetylmuramoyl-L-alanine amidase